MPSFLGSEPSSQSRSSATLSIQATESFAMLALPIGYLINYSYFLNAVYARGPFITELDDRPRPFTVFTFIDDRMRAHNALAKALLGPLGVASSINW